MYAGIVSKEFDCIITLLGQKINVRLIYYKEENRWRWFIGRYGVDGKGYSIELDESLIQEDFLFVWSFSAKNGRFLQYS